jgi:hypothetical protein
MKFILQIALILVLFNLNAENTLTDQKINLTLRQIGNRVLWATGDSSTRILPVSRFENTYTIRFEKPTPINYDSIVVISSDELSKIGINYFLAEIKGCGNDDVYLSFAVNREEDNIAPCLGREIANLCYDISITLTKKKTGVKDISIPVLLTALLSTSFLIHYVRRKRAKSGSLTDFKDKTIIGDFEFLQHKSQLKIKEQIIMLSDKENLLLSILIKSINQPVTRELLMDKIWGSNGVLVLSRNIDVLVSKLRKKLADDPSLKITNVHGVGYKLETN